MMKLWVDDIRLPPDGWVWAKNYDQAIDLLKTNEVSNLSLDHDLGDENEKTGYDIMRWIEEKAFFDADWSLPRIKFHTSNPAGRRNMNACLLAIKRRMRDK